MVSKLFIICTALAAVALSLTGCFMKSKNQYTIDQVSKVTLSRSSDSLTLSYTPMIESQFFSPGIQLIDSKDQAGKKTVAFVRCPVGKDCPVDFKGTYQDAAVTVSLPMSLEGRLDLPAGTVKNAP